MLPREPRREFPLGRASDAPVGLRLPTSSTGSSPTHSSSSNGVGGAAPTPLPSLRPTPLPPSLIRPVSVLSLVHALRRRMVLALSLGVLVGAATAVAAWRMLPASKYSAYTARALIRVSAVLPTVANETKRDDFGVYRATVMQLIKSRFVVDDVLKDEKVKGLETIRRQEEPTGFLTNEVQVDANNAPEIVRISLSGDRPEELATLVNSIVTTTISKVNGREQDDKQKTLLQLQKVKEKYESLLSGQRDRLKTLAKNIGTGESPSLALITVARNQGRLDNLNRELETAKTDLRNSQILLEMMQKKGKVTPGMEKMIPPPSRPIPSGGEEHSYNEVELNASLSRIAELKKEIRQIQSIAKDTAAADSLINQRKLVEQIASLEVEVDRHRQRAPKTGNTPVEPRPAPSGDYDKSIPELNRNIEVDSEKIKRLQADIDRETSDLARLKHELVEIEEIQKTSGPQEEMSKAITKLFEVLNVETLAPDRVTLIEPAEIPKVKEERRYKFAGLAGAAAFAFTLFAVAFLDFRTQKVYRISDITQGLEIPVVGTQPRTLPLGDGQVAWYDMPSDGIDGVRALLVQGRPQEAKLIVVTSSRGGEGSTSAAAGLAASLARAGRRTLLVDANLRQPGAHMPFGLSNQTGLSEVIRGEAKAFEVIQAAPLDRLWIMTAGQGDIQAIQGLAREGAFLLFDQLKRDYDSIVLDATPIVPAADSLPVAQRADAVLLAVLADQSRAPDVWAAWQRLNALGARVLGVIVQGAEDDNSGSYAYPFTRNSG